MIRIKWTSKSKKEKQNAPTDTGMVIMDRGRVRERTKGFGGGTRESGFPPFNFTFP